MKNEINLIKTNDLQGMIENDHIVKGATAHNQVVDTITQEFIERANSKTKEEAGLEILPYGSKIVVKPYGYNPYSKIETTEAGLIIGGENQPFHKSRETGEMEPDEQGISVAQVIEVGPDVRFVRPGDDIFTFKTNLKPFPFYNLGYYIVLEQNVDSMVNFGLAQRVKELKGIK